MHTNLTKTAEIAQAERELELLISAQRSAEMSDDRYYTNGRKDRDDRQISAARVKLADIRKDQSTD